MLSRRGFLQLIASACVAAGVDLPPLAALEAPDVPIPVRDPSATPIRGLRFTSLNWHRDRVEVESLFGHRAFVPGLLQMDATAELDPTVTLTHDEETALNRTILRGDPFVLDERMMNIRVRGEFMITDMSPLREGGARLTLRSIGPITIGTSPIETVRRINAV